MLKVTIEGVLPDGESVNKVPEGSFVSAFVVNRAEDGSEMHGVALGGGLTPQDYVEHVVYAVVDNIKKDGRRCGRGTEIVGTGYGSDRRTPGRARREIQAEAGKRTRFESGSAGR